jgi:hypothetical protein
MKRAVLAISRVGGGVSGIILGGIGATACSSAPQEPPQKTLPSVAPGAIHTDDPPQCCGLPGNPGICVYDDRAICLTEPGTICGNGGTFYPCPS